MFVLLLKTALTSGVAIENRVFSNRPRLRGPSDSIGISGAVGPRAYKKDICLCLNRKREICETNLSDFVQLSLQVYLWPSKALNESSLLEGIDPNLGDLEHALRSGDYILVSVDGRSCRSGRQYQYKRPARVAEQVSSEIFIHTEACLYVTKKENSLFGN